MWRPREGTLCWLSYRKIDVSGQAHNPGCFTPREGSPKAEQPRRSVDVISGLETVQKTKILATVWNRTVVLLLLD